MNNQPFKPKTLTDLEELLLRRLEATETAFAQLATLVGEQLPSTRQTLQAIGTQLQQSRSIADELAACLYLHNEGGDLDPVSAQALFQEGLKATQELDAAVTAVLPRAGQFAHPLALAADLLLHELPKAAELEMEGQPLGWEILHAQLPTTVGEIRQLTTALTTGSERVTVVIAPLLTKTPGLAHYLILTPSLNKWCILTLDNPRQHFFMHCQAQYLDLSEAISTVDAALVRKHPSRLRAYFKANPVANEMIAVLLGKVFAVDDGREQEVVKEGLYRYLLQYGHHKELGKVLSITVPGIPVQAVVQESDPSVLLLMANGEGWRTSITDMQEVSKNVLLDLLTAFTAKATKPKAAAVKAKPKKKK